MHTKAIALSVLATTALAAQTAQAQTDAPMTFFVTSTTHSGDLGGLAGADAECQSLAAAVGAGGHTWRAYLSTTGTQAEPGVNARDRIGDGPWHNANGVMIAANVADLHGDIERDRNLIYRETALTENGDLVNGRVRPEGENNEHDMLTGSDSRGRAYWGGLSNGGLDFTCRNWTYGGSDGNAVIGHHDRLSGWNTSWNSSHTTEGCSLADFVETGGAGRFYCFAAD
ncbi:MAG: lectin [Gammaproteobacteria bacterium]|nr:lectin [Gammaproteobacteria bacterium]